MFYTYYNSPLGKIVLQSDGNFLTGLWFLEQKNFGLLSNAILNNNLKIFQQTKAELSLYFLGKQPNFNLIPIKLNDTPCRMQIWELLKKIPYGKTTTYGAIANEIAKTNGNKKMSAQAVGNAVAHNPISIIIPCHRVLGKNNALVGYAGGLNKKRALLLLENNSIKFK